MEKSWQGYVSALGTNKPPKTTIDTGIPYPTTEGNTISTGFVQWKTPNPNIQAKYDAMSPSWGGIQASESAAATSVFKADYMPVSSVNK